MTPRVGYRVSWMLAVVSAITLPCAALAQTWEVIAPPDTWASAVGCSRPDVLGHSVCIAVDAGQGRPRVWMFGDLDGLWDAVAVSVDDGAEDGEVFVALPPHDGAPSWTDEEGARLIRALRSGSQAFVTTGVDEVFIDLSGAARVIDDVLVPR